jgi:protocatechuate 3,4-dioxygenase beta subunit
VTPVSISRRRLVRLLGAAPAALLLAACGGASVPTATSAPAVPPTSAPATATSAPKPTAQPAAATSAPATVTAAPVPTTKPAAAAPTAAQVLAATPACADDDDVTVAQTEGPYYTPNTPERASLLEPGMGGTKLLLTGRVLSTRCQPVPRALIDFWQADDKGQYDNVGFKLRGHQFSDAQGGWKLETIVPGLYPGRTRHIHVKVQAPNRPVLTTQLYFPDEPGNARDGIFNRELVMAVRDFSGGKEATFDFVLNV